MSIDAYILIYSRILVMCEYVPLVKLILYLHRAIVHS